MKNFEKDQITNLDQILGGNEPIVIDITGVLDGIRHNTDIHIGS